MYFGPETARKAAGRLVRFVQPVCALLAISFGSMAFVTAAFAQTPVKAELEAPVAALVPAPAAAPIPDPIMTPAVAPVTANTAQFVNPLIDGRQRLQWLFVENLGAGSLADDVAVGAVDTYFNTPKEYKPHWQGFGERTGMIAANYGVKSTMEAGLGSIWGEDPRYFKTTGLSVRNRMAYVIKMTFMARNQAGGTMPAYSRYIAFPASSFLSNAWQPTSESTATDAAVRVGLGFLSRMGENAWKEFIVPRK
jgi:hypothetical protein